MIVRSGHTGFTFPPRALHHFVLERAGDRGDKPALIDGPTGRTLTYAQLVTGVGRVAAALARRGFGRGDVLAIFLPNLPEFALAFHGTAAAGGTVTTISPLATSADLLFQLTNAGARFLVTIPGFLDRAMPAAQAAGIEEVFVVGGADGATPFASLLDVPAPAPNVDIDHAEDVVALPYSSGTTGFPKGVMLTHRNLVANIVQTGMALDIGDHDRLIAFLPFFHIYGMNVILNLGLSRGATLVTMPRFELESFLALIEEHRITIACVAPPVVLALAKHPDVDRFDLSSLHTVFSGAAPLDAALQDACATRLRCEVRQGYGLTEASPVTHITAAGAVRPGTIGPLAAGTECRIVDVSTGANLGPGQDGELWIRGPQVMKGYLNNPDATAATLDAEGWLHTGDIGRVDDDGYFMIVDRLKELIKHRGYQVPPAELEALLLTHPAVADAAVIGVPDAETGEVPKAFVVLKGEASPEELMAFVAAQVAPYKKIRQLELVDAIPKSPSGKILRRVLRDREMETRR